MDRRVVVFGLNMDIHSDSFYGHRRHPSIVCCILISIHYIICSRDGKCINADNWSSCCYTYAM